MNHLFKRLDRVNRLRNIAIDSGNFLKLRQADYLIRLLTARIETLNTYMLWMN